MNSGTLGPIAPFRPGQLWWAVPDERSLDVEVVDFTGVHRQTLLGIEAIQYLNVFNHSGGTNKTGSS